MNTPRHETTAGPGKAAEPDCRPFALFAARACKRPVGARRSYVRHRLYRQIYVGLVCMMLLAFLLVGSVFWLIGNVVGPYFGTESSGALNRNIVDPRNSPDLTDLLARLLPATDSPDELDRTLEQIDRIVPGDIALYDAQGQRIAASEHDMPMQLDTQARHRHQYVLPDDRQVLIYFGWQTKREVLAWLAGFVLLLGVAAWPVSRRLTRRIERLQAQADAWGEGRLSTRMAIDGCDEVTELAARFNQAADRVEALVSSQRAMLASASHELRSPLARIRMAIDLIGEERPDLQAQIARDIAELDALIGDLLLASRLADEAPRLNLGTVDLLGLAAEEAARADASAGGEPVSLQGDARLLRHLVRNLLDNARRYAPGSPIEVEVVRDGGRALLRVLDRGPGVPDEECERIFEPFYRIAGSAERGEGSGYGLALVRRIARLHGGDAGCSPRPGGGACFEVSLPL
ncbi:HAMP domain-containing sensor histidine kinase [Uliginosibacterium sp. H1]|uniref:HAMP domain-containing sensor histidine kinase n=1 Tax=Uliginosibacterium sp. H1 TaxID=3114757 RepID=UPI002E17BF60|nr:ATP-binding protein [Uliginosibacterium sp. H1]